MQQHHWGALSPLLDLTTAVFPVTKVDLEMDIVPGDWKPISDLDKKVMDHCKALGNLLEIKLTTVEMAVLRNTKTRQLA